MRKQQIERINVAFLSTYPPRACGLATFTEDLVREIDKIAPLYNPFVNTSIIAISDDTYIYDNKVIKEIDQFNKKDYLDLSKYLNNSEIDLLVIQHEYGIFGGESGEYLLDLIYNLSIPFTTVLHTVLTNPSEKQRHILREIGKYSEKVVTMAKNTIDLLTNIYEIEENKIVHIPHGVPYVYYGDREELKKELGLEGKIVISTFGLIGPGKGLEYGIEAVAKLKDEFPNVVYLILGRTHPGIIRNEGESYREKLLKMVEGLGVKENVIFVNKYLTKEEILKYLQASDIYMTPYLNKEQAVSGTLSYALACGRVIVSTAYRYAEELLADGRGILVDFRDSDGIYMAIRDVLRDEERRKEMEKKAFEYGKGMWWNVVAERYIEMFYEVVLGKDEEVRGWKKWSFSTPRVDHLFRLTDDTGILQHSKFSVPDPRFGYTTDDNSRALIVATMLYKQYREERYLELIYKYSSFILNAQTYKGNFRNFMSYDRKFLEEEGSEDCFGRVVWSLGVGIATKEVPLGVRNLYKELLSRSLKYIEELRSPRSKAYTILGLYYANKDISLSSLGLTEYIDWLAKSLVRQFRENSDTDWRWFEDIMAYSNAILPLFPFGCI